MSTTFTQKIWSVVLSIVLVMGLNPVAAFAADESSTPNESRVTAAEGTDNAAAVQKSPDSTTEEAVDKQTVEEGIATQATSTPYVTLYSDGTLIFRESNVSDTGHGSVVASWNSFQYYWRDEQYRNSIKRVEFIGSFKPTGLSLANLFEGCTNLVEVTGMNSIDTSSVETVDEMFKNCKSLKSIDLSSFFSESISYTSYMFFGCDALESVDISNLMVKVHSSMYPNDYAPNYYAMFLDCPPSSQ